MVSQRVGHNWETNTFPFQSLTPKVISGIPSSPRTTPPLTLQTFSTQPHSFWIAHSLTLIKDLFSPTHSDPFGLIQSLSPVWLFVTPWTAASQASLSITNSRSSLKLTSIESVMPSNHLVLSHPLILLPSVFPSIRVFCSWVRSSHQVDKVLEFQLQHQSFQWIFGVDIL